MLLKLQYIVKSALLLLCTSVVDENCVQFVTAIGLYNLIIFYNELATFKLLHNSTARTSHTSTGLLNLLSSKFQNNYQGHHHQHIVYIRTTRCGPLQRDRER